MTRSDRALKAVDEQGTKFVIIDSQTVDAYLLQSPNSSQASIPAKATAVSSDSTRHKRVPTGSNSKQASASCKLKSDKKPMEFNMWMFQQNQASFAAMSGTPPPCPVPPVPPPPPVAQVPNRNSTSKGGAASSGSDRSTNKGSSNDATPAASSALPFMIPPPPNGMIPPPTMLPPPPGFEAISLVLPAPPPPFNYFKNTLESSSISSSFGTKNSSGKKSESTSSSDHKQSTQRKRSDREFKHIKQSPKTVDSSDGECSPEEEPSKSKSRTNKSSKQSSNSHEENSRKRKRTRERSSSWSQDRKRSKESKKAKKSKKEKKRNSMSKKKSKSSSKILVAEVAKNSREEEGDEEGGGGGVGCCDNWMQEFYEEEVTLSDGEEGDENTLSSISNSSLSSSETSNGEDNSRSEGEISSSTKLPAIRRNQNSRSSSRDRSRDYKIPKRSSRPFKTNAPSDNYHRSESDSRHRYSSHSLEGSQISRRYSRRNSSSPEDTSRSDRRRVRREDNERLENSLQEFRQRKGMSRYNTNSHHTSSSKYSPGSRYSNPPFLPMGSSTSSFPMGSFFPNKSEKNSKNDDGSSNGDEGGEEDKHPLAGDDVSPMDRARIENYLKGCQQRYTYKSCGQIAFYDSHCHIDFLFKKTGYKKTYKQFRTVVPFPENYGGCVAVFCEPHAFSRFSIVEKVLEEENLVACFGCHPHSSNLYNNVLETNIRRMMSHPKVRAWGECGLDYSDRSRGVDKEIQQYVFRRQLKCAVELKKPLCVHSRQSDEDLFEILREEVPPDWKIHRHCYTESPEMALKMIEYFPNMYIGFTNVITYNNATGAIATACAMPLDRILLETDAPYFLPAGAPKSMKNSNPGMAIQVAERLSLLKSVPIEEVLKKTRQNLLEMYGL